MDILKLSFICFGGGGSYRYTPPVIDTSAQEARTKREAEEAAEKEAKLARKRRGRRSTILTSAMGLSGEADTKAGELVGKTKFGQ
jgi:hypothetical protein